MTKTTNASLWKTGRAVAAGIVLVGAALAGLFNATEIEEWWHGRSTRIEPLVDASNRALARSVFHPTVAVELVQDGAPLGHRAVMDVYLHNSDSTEAVFTHLTYPRSVTFPLSASTAPPGDLPQVVYEVTVNAPGKDEIALSPPFRIPARQRRAFRLVVSKADGSPLRRAPSMYLHDTRGNEVAVGLLSSGPIQRRQ